MAAATILTFFGLSPLPAMASNRRQVKWRRNPCSLALWHNLILLKAFHILSRLFPCMAYEKNTINKQVPLHLVPKIMLIFVIDDVFIYLVLTKTCTFSAITVLLYCWGNFSIISVSVNLVARFYLTDKFLNFCLGSVSEYFIEYWIFYKRSKMDSSPFLIRICP